MNKRCFLVALFVTSMFMVGINQSSAQVEVTKGSTHTYSVTPIPVGATYEYHWSVDGGTSSTFGTGATSNNIVWDGTAGSYTITVYPLKTAANCAGNNHTLSITVVDMNIIWTTNTSSQCPKTDNQTGDFTITANYTGVSGAWSYSYSIDGGLAQTVNVASGNSSNVTVPGFTNASNTTTETHTIRISSVTTADNYTVNYTGAEPGAATRLHSATVEPTPGTSGIIQL